MPIARAVSSSPRRVVARIQRLCCLGLGSQRTVPALLREIAELVPSNLREFYWADRDCELANIYMDTPILAWIAPLYLSEHYKKKERDYVRTFNEAMRTRYPSAVDDFFKRCLTVSWNDFLKTDGYNLLYRQMNVHRRLQMKVTEGDVALGALHVDRGEGESDFTPRDHLLLEALAPFVAHAMTDAEVEAPVVDSEDRGVAVASLDGKIEHISDAGRRLLIMAAHGSISPQVNWLSARRSMLPPPLVQLCRDVVAVFEEKTPREPPVLLHRNDWGEFEFRAYLLRPDDTSPSSSRISIVMQLREPLPLRLLRRLEGLPLSGREIEFCLLAAAGRSRAAIADRMGISEHTAITHGRNVYARLGVHNRVELFDRLRSL